VKTEENFRINLRVEKMNQPP